jgi:hypothetical protein
MYITYVHYIHTYISTYIHKHTHTHTYTHTHIHTYTHTYIHTHTHTHTHTCIAKWQTEWDRTMKGSTTKQFFPNIKDRLNVKLKLTPNFTAMVTAHGKTKAYLHRFKIIVSRMPLRRRESNGGPPALWLHQNAEGERETYKQRIKTRKVAGGYKGISEKIQKTLLSVYKLNRFQETMNLAYMKCQTLYDKIKKNTPACSITQM